MCFPIPIHSALAQVLCFTLAPYFYWAMLGHVWVFFLSISSNAAIFHSPCDIFPPRPIEQLVAVAGVFLSRFSYPFVDVINNLQNII